MQQCLVHYKNKKEFYQNVKYVDLWVRMVWFISINFHQNKLIYML